MATTITWPTTGNFPQTPRSQGYNESPPDTALHFGVDLGPAISFQRALEGQRPMSCVFDVTTAQLATFDAWFKNTIRGGTLSFSINHPRTGATIEAKILALPVYTNPGGDIWEIALKLTEPVS